MEKHYRSKPVAGADLQAVLDNVPAAAATVLLISGPHHDT
jgi:hypothetical protein